MPQALSSARPSKMYCLYYLSAWSLIVDKLNIPHHKSASSPTQLQPLQNDLRRHLDILSRTLYIMNTLPFTLQPNSTLQTTLLNSTLLKKRPVSVPSQAVLKPLEAGISVETSCRCPHCSVGPPTGTHLPEEGGWKKITYLLTLLFRSGQQIISCYSKVLHRQIIHYLLRGNRSTGTNA